MWNIDYRYKYWEQIQREMSSNFEIDICTLSFWIGVYKFILLKTINTKISSFKNKAGILQEQSNPPPIVLTPCVACYTSDPNHWVWLSKAEDDGTWSRAPATTCETCKKLLDLGFILARFFPLCPFGKLTSKWIISFFLSFSFCKICLPNINK